MSISTGGLAAGTTALGTVRFRCRPADGRRGPRRRDATRGIRAKASDTEPASPITSSSGVGVQQVDQSAPHHLVVVDKKYRDHGQTFRERPCGHHSGGMGASGASEATGMKLRGERSDGNGTSGASEAAGLIRSPHAARRAAAGAASAAALPPAEGQCPVAPPPAAKRDGPSRDDVPAGGHLGQMAQRARRQPGHGGIQQHRRQRLAGGEDTLSGVVGSGDDQQPCLIFADVEPAFPIVRDGGRSGRRRRGRPPAPIPARCGGMPSLTSYGEVHQVISW